MLCAIQGISVLGVSYLLLASNPPIFPLLCGAGAGTLQTVFCFASWLCVGPCPWGSRGRAQGWRRGKGLSLSPWRACDSGGITLGVFLTGSSVTPPRMAVKFSLQLFLQELVSPLSETSASARRCSFFEVWVSAPRAPLCSSETPAPARQGLLLQD